MKYDEIPGAHDASHMTGQPLGNCDKCSVLLVVLPCVKAIYFHSHIAHIETSGIYPNTITSLR